MPALELDPAPRSYTASVSVLRRADRGPSAAPGRTTIGEIEAWLLADAMSADDLLALFESLAWRLVAAGVPLDRASLHVGTLHPQVFGFAWNWERADGLCDEVKVAEATLKTDAYRRNPLFRVIEYGEVFRGDTGDPDTVSQYPLMAELARRGITEYDVMPLRAGGAYHNAASVATKQTGGFSDADRASLSHTLRLFALHVERHIASRIAANVLDTYLGVAAGEQVLHGSIKRGAGEAIRAIIWASDLRDFTDLSDRLAGSDIVALINAYFERLAGAVMAEGGEVLKFIGDGLLAVFPYASFKSEHEAARASLAAAERALQAVDDLNRAAPPELAIIEGWRPLRTGIALHEGEVFFGNVGAPDRLDFTVIGSAVNTASRVETLTKSLGRPILITEPVARMLDRPLDHLGKHALRGLATPLAIFSPRTPMHDVHS
jgi:adenylate cyclase